MALDPDELLVPRAVAIVHQNGDAISSAYFSAPRNGTLTRSTL